MKDIKEERLQQVLNKVYEASSQILDKRVTNGFLQGNSHHMAQAIQAEVERLVAPLIKYDVWLSESRREALPISPQELEGMTLRSSPRWAGILDAIREALLEKKASGRNVLPSVRINPLYADMAVKACEEAGWVATHETDSDTQYRRLVIYGAMCGGAHEYEQIRFSDPTTPRTWLCKKCSHRTRKNPDE